MIILLVKKIKRNCLRFNLKILIAFIWVIACAYLILSNNLYLIILEYSTQHKIVSPLILILLHILMSVLVLPSSPIPLVAGLIWGSTYGLIIIYISTFLSSSITFLIARKNQKKFESFKGTLFDVLPKQISSNGLIFILLLYLNPFLPTTSFGYIFGLSKISFNRYLLILLFCPLPLIILMVSLGSVGKLLFN